MLLWYLIGTDAPHPDPGRIGGRCAQRGGKPFFGLICLELVEGEEAAGNPLAVSPKLMWERISRNDVFPAQLPGFQSGSF